MIGCHHRHQAAVAALLDEATRARFKDQKIAMVITGGNKGIGYEAIKTLLPLGYHIIIGKQIDWAMLFFWHV